MSTGTSEVYILLKIPSDSISEGVIFKISWGHAPDPLAMACLCASYIMSVNMSASPTSTMMTGLVVPPFQKSRSAPVSDGAIAGTFLSAMLEKQLEMVAFL